MDHVGILVVLFLIFSAFHYIRLGFIIFGFPVWMGLDFLWVQSGWDPFLSISY